MCDGGITRTGLPMFNEPEGVKRFTYNQGDMDGYTKSYIPPTGPTQGWRPNNANDDSMGANPPGPAPGLPGFYQYVPIPGYGEEDDLPDGNPGAPLPPADSNYDPPVTPGVGGDAPQRPVGAGTGDQPNKQPTPLPSGGRGTTSRSLLNLLEEEELLAANQRKR